MDQWDSDAERGEGVDAETEHGAVTDDADPDSQPRAASEVTSTCECLFSLLPRWV